MGRFKKRHKCSFSRKRGCSAGGGPSDLGEQRKSTYLTKIAHYKYISITFKISRDCTSLHSVTSLGCACFWPVSENWPNTCENTSTRWRRTAGEKRICKSWLVKQQRREELIRALKLHDSSSQLIDWRPDAVPQRQEFRRGEMKPPLTLVSMQTSYLCWATICPPCELFHCRQHAITRRESERSSGGVHVSDHFLEDQKTTQSVSESFQTEK